MNNNDLLKEIGKHVNIMEMHVKRLLKKPADIHEIDIDLMAEKLKDLYALVFELETGKAIEVINDEPLAPETVTESANEPVPEPVAESEPEPEPVPEPAPVREPEPTPAPEHIAVSEPAPEPADDQEPEPEPEAKTTADLFTGSTTIADSFQAEEDKSIAARVVPQAVEDLKMAIGINDKFLFINELFKGSPTEYNEAIETLNTSGGMTHAETAMNDYRTRYEWSEQSEAYNRLKKIVQSKFNGS